MEYNLNSKERNIAQLYKARSTHIRWMNSVKFLVSGLSIKDKIPLPLSQDSYLGQWYYNEALHFSQFNSQQTLTDIEVLIESIYTIYMKIYLIYCEEKLGVLQTIFGSKNISKNDHILASKYYEEMLSLSDQLKKKLAVLERQLSALSLEQHEEIKIFDNDRDLELKVTEVNTIEKKNYYYGARSY